MINVDGTKVQTVRWNGYACQTVKYNGNIVHQEVGLVTPTGQFIPWSELTDPENGYFKYELEGWTQIPNAPMATLAGVLTVPENAVKFQDNCFRDCANLTGLNITAPKASIYGSLSYYHAQPGIFYGCNKLQSLSMNDISIYSPDAGSVIIEPPLGWFFGEEKANNTDYYGATQYFWKGTTDDSEFKLYYIPNSLKSVTVGGGFLENWGFFMNLNIASNIKITKTSMVDISPYYFYNTTTYISTISRTPPYILNDYCLYNVTNLSTILGTSGKIVEAKYVGYYSLYGTNITTLNMYPYDEGGSITISEYACGNCKNLTKVYFRGNLTSETLKIRADAFNGCTNLHDFYYNGTMDEFIENGKVDPIKDGYREAGWDNGVPDDYIVHCTDGDLTKQEAAGIPPANHVLNLTISATNGTDTIGIVPYGNPGSIYIVNYDETPIEGTIANLPDGDYCDQNVREKALMSPDYWMENLYWYDDDDTTQLPVSGSANKIYRLLQIFKTGNNIILYASAADITQNDSLSNSLGNIVEVYSGPVQSIENTLLARLSNGTKTVNKLVDTTYGTSGGAYKHTINIDFYNSGYSYNSRLHNYVSGVYGLVYQQVSGSSAQAPSLTSFYVKITSEVNTDDSDSYTKYSDLPDGTYVNSAWIDKDTISYDYEVVGDKTIRYCAGLEYDFYYFVKDGVNINIYYNGGNTGDIVFDTALSGKWNESNNFVHKITDSVIQN